MNDADQFDGISASESLIDDAVSNSDQLSSAHADSTAASVSLQPSSTTYPYGEGLDDDSEADESVDEDEDQEDEEDEDGDEFEFDEDGLELDDEVPVVETLIPIRLVLQRSEGAPSFHDQFLWPVVLPATVLGRNFSEYLLYNVNYPRIDIFATRTAEELNLPNNFDSAIARSIRAQIRITMPILWKERLYKEKRHKKLSKKKTQAIEKQELSHGDSLLDVTSDMPLNTSDTVPLLSPSTLSNSPYPPAALKATLAHIDKPGHLVTQLHANLMQPQHLQIDQQSHLHVHTFYNLPAKNKTNELNGTFF